MALRDDGHGFHGKHAQAVRAELETLARQGKSFKDVFKASVMSQGFRHRVTAP